MQPPPVYHPLLSFSLSLSLSLFPPVFTFFPRSIYSPFPRNSSIFFQIILDRFFRLFSGSLSRAFQSVRSHATLEQHFVLLERGFRLHEEIIGGGIPMTSSQSFNVTQHVFRYMLGW